MDLSGSRRTVAKSNVVAGSVWESRMKNDAFKGGIKVFNGEESNNDGGGNESLKKSQNFGKRKTWKNESFEKTPIQIGEVKAEEQCKKSPVKVVAKGKDLSLSVDGIKKIPVHSKKERSELDSVRVLAQSGNGNDDKVLVFDDEKIEGNEKDLIETLENGSESEEQHCKGFGVCQEMVKSSSSSDDEFYEEDEGNEAVNGKKSFDIKEMNAAEKKFPEVNKTNKAVNEVKKWQVGNEVKKISQFHNKTAPFSSTVNKQTPPVVKQATSVHATSAKPTNFTPSSDDNHYHSFPQTQNKLQSLVDLVMWRDVSKSALIFGIGTFIIISSSYTQDLNISCITVISYTGLVYLAAIFLYRTIICRGVVDIDESSYVIGEEGAIWVLKLVLPYVNEFLLKLRALFSGDPSTTMKLAVLLFVLAKCGSSITIWKMATLGFFGVFTVPKVCSSYSHQLSAYGAFCIGWLRDTWESCSHKKAVAVAIFTLVWNLSSIVARIWAAFMLFVAFRYYQQKMATDDNWVEAETVPSNEESRIGRHRHGLGPSKMLPNKLKKRS